MERLRVTLRVRDRDNQVRVSHSCDASPSAIASKAREMGTTIQKTFERVLTPGKVGK